MKASEKQELKRKIGRIGLFLLIVFVPALVIDVLIFAAGVYDSWIHILVLVVLLFILFFIYTFILTKLDQRKAERMKKKKDPFSD